MVPVPGFYPGAIPRTIISTASDQHSLGTAVFRKAAGSTDSIQTGLPSAIHGLPQVMISSTITPHMTKLKISNASSMQLQKPVEVEESTATRDQIFQTAEGSRDSSEHVLPVMIAAQGDPSLPVEAATVLQHGVGIMSTDQSNQSLAGKTYSGLSQSGEKKANMNNAAAATERHHELPEISTYYDLEEILVSFYYL